MACIALRRVIQAVWVRKPNVARAIRRAGSVSSLALAIGVAPSTVRRWRSGGAIKKAHQWRLSEYLEGLTDDEVFRNVLGGVKIKVNRFDRKRTYEKTPGWEFQEPIRLMGAKAVHKVLTRLGKFRRKQHAWCNIDLVCSQWGEGQVGSKATYIKGSPDELTAEIHVNSGLQRNIKNATEAIKEKLLEATDAGVIVYIHSVYVASYDRIGMPNEPTTGR